MAEHVEKFQAGKQEIEATVQRLPISFQQTLKTIFGNVAVTERERTATDFNLGQAENIVMRDAMVHLKVNGNRVKLDPNDPLLHVPQHQEDDDYWDELPDKILRAICRYNRPLYNEKKPWGMYFGQYAPEEADAEEKQGFTESPNDTEPEREQIPAPVERENQNGITDSEDDESDEKVA
jgi:hypothetical protein